MAADILHPSRREFLVDSGRFAAASALAGLALPAVHLGGTDTIRIALVGCGGRGVGAAVDALSVPDGRLELVALCDVFDGKPDRAGTALKARFADAVDVPAERRFVGFDGYRHAMDCLLPGDLVILATPPAFRWLHYRYAVEKGLHVFMEKPVSVDGPTSKRMLEINAEALTKGLKVGVGLMSRHNHGMRELKERIEAGEIGDVMLMRGYRKHGPVAFFRSRPKPDGISDLMYQIQRFHSFLWASGGCFNDYYIHIIDHLCWMKGAWPTRAEGVGGRHFREDADGPWIDQNFDSYSVEYQFDDGARLFFEGRCIPDCHQHYASYAHGSKGMAVVSNRGDCGLPSRIYSGQTMADADLQWRSDVPRGQRNPYQNEWNALIAAIRADQPYNEVETSVKTTLVSSMGRMAAHTGQAITYREILDGDHEFAPDVAELTLDSPAPLLPGPDGRYRVPMPGRTGRREY